MERDYRCHILKIYLCHGFEFVDHNLQQRGYDTSYECTHLLDLQEHLVFHRNFLQYLDVYISGSNRLVLMILFERMLYSWVTLTPVGIDCPF